MEFLQVVIISFPTSCRTVMSTPRKRLRSWSAHFSRDCRGDTTPTPPIKSDTPSLLYSSHKLTFQKIRGDSSLMRSNIRLNMPSVNTTFRHSVLVPLLWLLSLMPLSGLVLPISRRMMLVHMSHVLWRRI